MANCARCKGLHSELAPASNKRKYFCGVGSTVAIAGRSTFSNGRSLTVAAATRPPVLPREIIASPWPCLTSSKARAMEQDRKSTRLNSSHTVISYAVFCLKKKKHKKKKDINRD